MRNVAPDDKAAAKSDLLRLRSVSPGTLSPCFTRMYSPLLSGI